MQDPTRSPRTPRWKITAQHGRIPLSCCKLFTNTLIRDLKRSELGDAASSPNIAGELSGILSAKGTILDTSLLTSTQAHALGPYPERIYFASIESWEKQDETLSILRKMQDLEVLSIGPRAITAVEAQWMSAAEKLRILRIGGCGINDRLVETISSLKNLEELSLRNNPVGDKGIESLLKMPKLLSLGLQNTNISDKGVEALGGLKALQYLYLNGTKVSNRSVKALSVLPDLEYLSLKDTDIDDVGAEALLGLRALKEVVLEGTKVSEHMISNLEGAGLEIS